MAGTVAVQSRWRHGRFQRPAGRLQVSHGRQHPRRQGCAEHPAALLRNPESRFQHRLGRGGAQAEQQRRLQDVDFRQEPATAGVDFLLRRGLVEATLATGFPFEVLDRISEITGTAIDSGLPQCTVQ
jgi:hypothetical protein